MGLTPLRQTKQKLAEETDTQGANHPPVIHVERYHLDYKNKGVLLHKLEF